MANTINGLTTTLANALGLPRKLVNETARYLREAGLLPDGDASVREGRNAQHREAAQEGQVGRNRSR